MSRNSFFFMAFPSSRDEVLDQTTDHVDGGSDRVTDGRAEAHALAEVGGFAADHEHPWRQRAEGSHRREQRTRFETVRVERFHGVHVDRGFEDGHRARLIAA